MLRPSFRLYTLELTHPWAIASRLGISGNGISQRDICLLRLEDKDGVVGLGEAAPVQTYSESLLTVLNFFRQIDWTRLSFDDLESSLAFVHHSTSDPSARAAIDIALHNGASKKQQRSLAQLLNIEPTCNADGHPSCFSLGLAPPESLYSQALAADRFPSLKLKASSRGFAESLDAVRKACPNKPLRVDGNEAWKTKEEALRHIETAARSGHIEFIEQPMPRDAAETDLQWLKARSPLPLFADESCRDLKDLDACLAGFHGINAKLAKAGGLSPSLKLILAAKCRGFQVQLGCMIESSLGIGAALTLADEVDFLDLDGALLVRNDPFQGVDEKHGKLSISKARSPTFGLPIQAKSKRLWFSPIPRERPISERAQLKLSATEYGRSINGIPLQVYLPSSGICDVLLFASIHGEEPETTALLSKALRSLDAPSPNCAVVLCANPDGSLLGTRCNAQGVELNRNFPSTNWQSGSVSTKWAPDHGYVRFSTGHKPASEPETQALIDLVEALQPKSIIALHAPLACIEDPDYTPLGYHLAKAARLPLVSDIGYPTPGSFGSWAKEHGYHVITYELPPVSVSEMHGQCLDSIVSLLRFGTSETQRASVVQ